MPNDIRTGNRAKAQEASPKAASPLSGGIEAIVHADHGDPFAILGMHQTGKDQPVEVRAFIPGAEKLWVVDSASGDPVGEADKVHGEGFFVAVLSDRKEPFRYRLRVQFPLATVEFEDAYRFWSVLGELDIHLLAEGTHLKSFERLGAHPREIDGVAGVAFAVWAPNARRVSVVGDFCDWDGRRLPMRKRTEAGVWEIFVPHATVGQRYKFEIKGAGGDLLPLKSDPYAFQAEFRPQTASVVHGLPSYDWQDAEWQRTRSASADLTAPISIYEVHLGSWARVPEEGDRFLTYRELAERLVPYVKDLGFTHIELLPITEHPFDGSWGYQPIGMYAPTSRHGTPEDFKYFVDACHAAGIGLLLDWVPGHFPTDPHGLGWFDGTHLYEHADPRQGYHQDWNTLIYNFGRTEVQNFLLGNALFWLEHYRLDGLRVDAVASMLYLDYSRKAGEWVPNRFGGRENLESIAFLKRMNELTYGHHQGIMTVAEESTAWPAVSRPVYLGGLGFGYKWNMGWMHDTLEYMAKDPIHRRYHHHQLTFGLIYQFSENFVLPLSHDEVVHGKGSLINKMPGDDWQKFANLRAYYGFMFAHPGKKLLFMGGEFGQWREWSEARSLDWHLLEEPLHHGLHALVRDLNGMYRGLKPLHQTDCDPAGFEWIEANDSDNSVLAFLRKSGEDPEHHVVVVCNFTPMPRDGYRVGVTLPGRYEEVLNTDAPEYGGSGVGNAGGVASEETEWHGRPHSITLTLPPLGTLVLERKAG
ncbi:1,4-alpha-glucan branching protein GlgB [Azospirillum brasilense]|uniref:1,4-alpha-glucan branching enzyme GlgB n=1 Tax=Azospirillum brasilense TaxID=192 RepID=A0A0P0EAA7_AZOBR|nr:MULTISPECIES: 1,4-alpha-glucan branching protein GlgB [Azospirillum]ALJ35527.1 glycogen branching protein [Azospirillum brasilense]MDW7555613.1 1,4-alpha-glucan branching protein GlgB [Azospirillum brasilense]MDW7595540.1 1,4-alpha-glucan branching protein GlgB [Azospirillum brasilense]MDW7630545.1 1,4-alpha-glucan branching protein GlgB [Azospirillum brasilense]MDX5954259.1 1,4-alpha-glucan branching protein GlgB [Azospirillum brasilense]